MNRIVREDPPCSPIDLRFLRRIDKCLVRQLPPNGPIRRLAPGDGHPVAELYPIASAAAHRWCRLMPVYGTPFARSGAPPAPVFFGGGAKAACPLRSFG